MCFQLKKEITLQDQSNIIIESYYDEFMIVHLNPKFWSIYVSKTDNIVLFNTEDRSFSTLDNSQGQQQALQLRKALGEISINKSNENSRIRYQISARSTNAVLRSEAIVTREEALADTCYLSYINFSSQTSAFSVPVERSEFVVEMDVKMNIGGQRSTSHVRVTERGQFHPVPASYLDLIRKALI